MGKDGFGGRRLKIKDQFQEPLLVVHLNNTKLGQMTNLKVIFRMIVSIFKLDTQSPVQPQSDLHPCDLTGTRLDKLQYYGYKLFPFLSKVFQHFLIVPNHVI